MALKVRRQAEGFAAFGAALAADLGVQLQADGVGKRPQAEAALVHHCGVGLLVVEQRSGVAVRAAAQVTPESQTFRLEPADASNRKSPIQF